MLILKDDDILFNTMFAVMEKFDDDEEAEEEVTLWKWWVKIVVEERSS